MADILAERQASILRALVREYVRSGEPVGSKALVDRGRIKASSATVRNEMAHLEEHGFVIQPHTSAGRIPTDLGYRFVVDELAPRPLSESQRRAIEEELSAEPVSVDDLLHRASDVLARFTHHAVAVLSRRSRATTLRRIELFSVGARMAMCVAIADNGRVEQRMIPLEGLVTDADVERLAEEFVADLTGSDLEEALRRIDAAARAKPHRERALIDAVRASMQALFDSETHVVVGGVANLAQEPTFERDQLQRLYEALEAQTAMLELLTAESGDALSVRIGNEVPVEDLRSCSVIVANFGIAGSPEGSIGVIGPTRMDYERVISTARTVARLLAGALDGT